MRGARLIHQDRLVRRLPVDCCTPVAGSSLAEEEAIELERLLRSLADRHRLRILNMLVQAGAPVCVAGFVSANSATSRGSSCSFDDSPVRSFVLTLAERRARDCLRQPVCAVLA